MRGLAKLASLPALWLGQLAGALRLPARVPLLKAAWWISGDGHTGCQALLAVQAVAGRDRALAEGVGWTARRPGPEIAAFTGLLAVDAGDLDAGQRLLDRGRALGNDRAGLLDYLEYALTECRGPESAVVALARRFEGRSDLPATLSRALLTRLLWSAMLDGRLDEAERRAAHLLQVDHVPEAEIALWALARRRGDPRRAQGHLKRADLPPARLAFFQVLGCLAVGATDDARLLLPRLHDLDPLLAQRAEGLLNARMGVPWT